MDLTGVVAFWMLLAVVVGVAAHKRGRMGFGWFVLAVMLSPLIAGLLLLAVGGAAESTDPSTHRQCPDCAEKVLRAARVCKHCGCQLEPLGAPGTATAREPYRPPNPALGRLYIGLAVLFVAWLLYNAFA